jgi:hypothetical protein
MEPRPARAAVSDEEMVESQLHGNTAAADLSTADADLPVITSDASTDGAPVTRRRPYVCQKCAGGVPHEFRHGLGGHSNHRCRCAICKAAKRDNMRTRRAAKKGVTNGGRDE